MEIQIRPAGKTDLAKYTKFLQKTYQDVYAAEGIGLKKEYFSVQIFNSARVQKYLASNLKVNDHQKCWLAFIGAKMVGSITIIERKNEYELRGFYVATKYQSKGIGKKLWNLARGFAKDKDVTCDIYAHNEKTIDVYKKWGFIIDKKKGDFYRHWEEWPKGVRVKCLYMRYSHYNN